MYHGGLARLQGGPYHRRVALDIHLEFLPIFHAATQHEFTERDLASLDAAMGDLFARGQRFVTLFDTSGTAVLPEAKMRRAIADWLERIEPQMKRYNLGSANVVASGAVRGMLTAIHWIFPPAVPQHYSPDPLDALAWCEKRLAEAGMSNPAVEARLREHFASRTRAASGGY
jgi:hypothetical protein